MKSKLVWYCGEPLRALWEDRISGIDYRELSCTVRSTSVESYGKSFTFLFLSNGFYSASVSFLRALDKLTAHRYSTIITNSKYTKKVVERIYGLDKPIPVVYPGVENHQYKQETADKELEGYILAVGAMIPMKNHAALLKAFSNLQREHRLKVKLIIVGNGPLENEIRSLVCKLDLKNVIFEPKVSEHRLSNYYANCMFVVHLALYEPFGLVPVEAAFHGKPSIVSNNGGTSEFVIHGENGFIVNPKNQKDVANAMERLIEDRRLSAEMGLKAKERALKEFTIEKSAENLARTLETRI
jgi:glycosyltransferase involved in cell wall biosynthesis